MSYSGLLIPRHVLLSEENHRENVTKTSSRAALVCFGQIFTRVFVRQQYITTND